MSLRVFAGRLASGLALRWVQVNWDSGFLYGIGHATQFLVLVFQFTEVLVTSREFTQPVLQIGIERVDILGADVSRMVSL